MPAQDIDAKEQQFSESESPDTRKSKKAKKKLLKHKKDPRAARRSARRGIKQKDCCMCQVSSSADDPLDVMILHKAPKILNADHTPFRPGRLRWGHPRKFGPKGEEVGVEGSICYVCRKCHRVFYPKQTLEALEDQYRGEGDFETNGLDEEFQNQWTGKCTQIREKLADEMTANGTVIKEPQNINFKAEDFEHIQTLCRLETTGQRTERPFVEYRMDRYIEMVPEAEREKHAKAQRQQKYTQLNPATGKPAQYIKIYDDLDGIRRGSDYKDIAAQLKSETKDQMTIGGNQEENYASMVDTMFDAKEAANALVSQDVGLQHRNASRSTASGAAGEAATKTTSTKKKDADSVESSGSSSSSEEGPAKAPLALLAGGERGVKRAGGKAGAKAKVKGRKVDALAQVVLSESEEGGNDGQDVPKTNKERQFLTACKQKFGEVEQHMNDTLPKLEALQDVDSERLNNVVRSMDSRKKKIEDARMTHTMRKTKVYLHLLRGFLALFKVLKDARAKVKVELSKELYIVLCVASCHIRDLCRRRMQPSRMLSTLMARCAPKCRVKASRTSQ